MNASRTALGVARRRALHQVYDQEPRILDDHVAIPILGAESAVDVITRAGRPEQYADIALRAYMVGRSRYAEDQLRQAYRRGVRQYCLLGAGFDTFAYRNPFPDLHVFEVDHPTTQALKRERLAQASVAEPDQLTFVPIDLDKELLADKLAEAGLSDREPCFFGWLGVISYLTLKTFREIIQYLTCLPQGSSVAADYGLPLAAIRIEERPFYERLEASVARQGERFRLLLSKEEMGKELRGFRMIEDIGRSELNERYFQGRVDALRVIGSGHRLFCASV